MRPPCDVCTRNPALISGSVTHLGFRSQPAAGFSKPSGGCLFTVFLLRDVREIPNSLMFEHRTTRKCSESKGKLIKQSANCCLPK